MRNYIAHARMEQHFRPTMADPGYDVVTENRYFVAGAGRRVGGAVVLGQRLEVGRRPPAVSAAAAREGPVAAAAAPLRRGLPLSARRHASASTASTATSSVRAGAGRQRRSTAARSGSIDGRSRASACRRCRAACRRRSSRTRRCSDYTPVATIGDQPVFLFSGLTARQIVLIAGRNLLVEKSVAFSDFRVNDPELRARARRGARERPRSCSARPIAACATTSRRTARASSATGRRSDAEGDGHGRDARSVVRVSAADLRHQLPRLRVRSAGHAARDALCRRAGRGQHPAAEARRARTLDASVDFFAIAVPSSDRIYDAERRSRRPSAC